MVFFVGNTAWKGRHVQSDHILILSGTLKQVCLKKPGIIVYFQSCDKLRFLPSELNYDYIIEDTWYAHRGMYYDADE
jgi:hypothetical protein